MKYRMREKGKQKAIQKIVAIIQVWFCTRADAVG
jgi:hypothetical protein